MVSCLSTARPNSGPAARAQTYYAPVELTTVILNVGDAVGLDGARRWYEEVLGLVADSEIPDHSVWYRTGSILVGLHVGVPLTNPENVCMGFEVADVDDLFRRLSARGIKFDGEPMDKSWGARAVTTYDPVGHMVTLGSPRHTT